MQLVSKHLGNSQEQVPCPVACHVAFGPFPCVSVHRSISPMTKDEEHSMCQNSICVIFNITVFILVTIVIPQSGLALCLGLFLCMLMIKTCTTLNYSETGDCGCHSYWKFHCSSLTVTGWPSVFCGFFDTWWYFILAGRTLFLLKEPCKILHRQCMWSMLCCYENEHQKVYIMLFYYVFAFGVELSNFHQNLPRALHCHDNWGFTSLSTLMICRLLVVFLYLFLNILCGIFSGICLFKFGLVFLKWWSYF